MKELRFYLVNPDWIDSPIDLYDLSDEEFIELSEKQGTVYSITRFESAFNNEDINSFTQFLRILEI